LRLLIRNLLCLLLLCAFNESWGQVSTDDLSVSDTLTANDGGQELNVYRHYITWSPSAFFNATPGVQIGYEYSLNRNFAAIVDGGYLTSPQSQREGYRLRLELRYYTEHNLILGLEGVRKQTLTSARQWLDVGTHSMLLDFTGVRKLTYGAFKMGYVSSITGNDQVAIEVTGSLGLGTYDVSTRDLPDGMMVDRAPFQNFAPWSSSFRDRRGIVPLAAIGIKIKFGLGRIG